MNIKGKHRHQLKGAGCDGKRRYDDKAAAEGGMRWLLQARYSRIARPPAMSAYQCRFCGFWHFGRTPKRVMQQTVPVEPYDWQTL